LRRPYSSFASTVAGLALTRSSGCVFLSRP
jgi:hypothetical protein